MKNVLKNNGEWRMSDPTRLQIWKSGSRQRYLTPPMKLPISELIERGDIQVPRLKKNPFSDYGIIASAFSCHKRGFYVERAKTAYYILAFILSGSYSLKCNGTVFRVKKGMFYSAPPAVSLTSSSPKSDITALWFHIKKTPYWRQKLGCGFFSAKSERVGTLAMLCEILAEAVYGSGVSKGYLRNTAMLIFENIDAELARFSGDEILPRKLENAAKWAVKNGGTAAQTAKRIGISVAELDSRFQCVFGMTFSKYVLSKKMEFARSELMHNTEIGKLARKCGFADRFSFSKSYTRYWGETPRGKIGSDET